MLYGSNVENYACRILLNFRHLMDSVKWGDIFCELPKGCIITIGTMGCQTEIAEIIVAKQADYVLAVGQPTTFT